MIKIVKEKRIFDNYFQIDEATIQYTSEIGKQFNFKRLKLERNDSVAIFILNCDTGNVILTRQFRYPVAAKTEKPLLEIPAGYIDKEELTVDAAIREVKEETGYQIRPENILQSSSFFISPGYSSEKIYLFHATVKNSDKKALGGGEALENEFIKIQEISYDSFINLIENGEIDDSKTIIAGLLSKQYLKKLL